MIETNKIKCPQEIIELCGITDMMNKYGGPVWMDFSPGSYVNKEGKVVYTQNHTCEYVDKEIIRDLFNKFVETSEDKYKIAINYLLNN